MTIKLGQDTNFIKRLITYLLLFLMALNFGNMFYVLYIVFAVYFVFFEGKAVYSKKAFGRICLLGLFSIVYLSVYFWYNEFEISKLIVYTSFPIMFAFGNTLYLDNKKWKTPIWVIAIGLAVHGCLNFITNFSLIFSGKTVRETIDYWLQEEWIATGQISLFILLAGCTYYILFCVNFKTAPFFKVVLILLLLTGIVYNIRLATRTVVYACGLSLVIGIVIRWCKDKRDASKRMHYMSRILVVLSIIAIVYFLNVFGIRDWITDSPLYQRVANIQPNQDMSLEGRWGQIVGAIQRLGKNPWGGYTMEFSTKLDFIHNTWLNIAYGCGTLSAILFLLYSITLILDVWTINKKRVNDKNSIFVTGIYVAMFVYWMLEPVCEAVPSMITLFSFINGVVLAQLQKGNLFED